MLRSARRQGFDMITEQQKFLPRAARSSPPAGRSTVAAVVNSSRHHAAWGISPELGGV